MRLAVVVGQARTANLDRAGFDVDAGADRLAGVVVEFERLDEVEVAEFDDVVERCCAAALRAISTYPVPGMIGFPATA